VKLGSVAVVEPEGTPLVVRDVFPAEVAVAGVVFRSARAVVTRERVYVWLAQDGAPKLVLSSAYDPATSSVAVLNAPRSKASHLQLADDDEYGSAMLHVNGQRGCGCSSPLKAFTPWQPYRKVAS
jgi:hypothetical protein